MTSNIWNLLRVIIHYIVPVHWFVDLVRHELHNLTCTWHFNFLHYSTTVHPYLVRLIVIFVVKQNYETGTYWNKLLNNLSNNKIYYILLFNSVIQCYWTTLIVTHVWLVSLIPLLYKRHCSKMGCLSTGNNTARLMIGVFILLWIKFIFYRTKLYLIELFITFVC